MRGVSSIIVAILLLMISVSLASFAYLFSTQTLSVVTETGTEASEQMISPLLAEMRISSVSDNEIDVRNTGKTKLSNIAVYINNILVDFSIDSSEVLPGGTAVITLSSSLEPGDTVKVVSAEGAIALKSVLGGSGETTICIPDGCNGNCPAYCSVIDDSDCGCSNGNGCCGIGCTSSNDNDCAPVCTPNGCNGNCPSGCTVSQDPDCGCANNNGCCPSGCTYSNDNDCPPTCTANGNSCLTGSQCCSGVCVAGTCGSCTSISCGQRCSSGSYNYNSVPVHVCDNSACITLFGEGQGDCDCNANCQSGYYCEELGTTDRCCPTGTNWDGSSCTVPVPADLVAYWKFDESSGTTASDSSGNGNTGTLYGGLSSTGWRSGSSCISGSCLRFDGTNDYIRITNSQSLDLQAPFSVEAWVYPTATPSTWNSIIYAGGSRTSQPYTEVELSLTSSRQVWWCTNNGLARCFNSGTVPLNAWSHIVGTWDGTTMRSYINGTQVGTMTLSGTVTEINNDALIGAGVDVTEPQYFNGIIDELKVFTKALTAAEVQAEYETASPQYPVLLNNKLSLGFQLDGRDIKQFVDSSTLRNLAEEANFKVVRFFHHRYAHYQQGSVYYPVTNWNNAQMDGTFNWAETDDLINKIIGIGAKPHVVLMYKGTGSASVPSGMQMWSTDIVLPDPYQYAAYCAKWVERYGTTIEYEIANEMMQHYYWNSPTLINRYYTWWHTIADAMRNENPNIKIGDESATEDMLDKFVYEGETLDFVSFHKYDSSSSYSATDSQLFSRAENDYFNPVYGSNAVYSVSEIRNVMGDSNFQVECDEANINWDFDPSDSRIQTMTAAVWAGLSIRYQALHGLNYWLWWDLAGRASSQTKFGMINLDNYKPWYPYYVMKWFESNSAVGDSIVDITVSSNSDIRTLSWIHGSTLNIMLIHKSTTSRSINLGGVTGQFNYQKIDDPSGTTYNNPVIQTGTVNGGGSISLNGYTVMLLQQPV
jgi:archaellum component FlaF (FlaF/FlaG flagellin family)